MATQVYDDPPRFIQGHSVMLGVSVLALVCDVVLYMWLKKINQQRDAEAAIRRAEGLTDSQNVASFEDLCDYHPDWRYPL